MFAEQLLNGLISGGIYTLIALGFTVVFGILGALNFAHGELFIFGGYFTLLFSQTLHLPFVLSILIAIVITAGIGMIFELVGFRPLRQSPVTATMISGLGLSLLAQNGALLLWGADAQPINTPYSAVRISFVGLSASLDRLMVIPVTLVLIIILTYLIQRTRMGLAMRACADDIEAAGWVGVNINVISLATFAISAALAAAAGALVGPISMVQPSMGFDAMVRSFAVVLLGGLGNVPGAIAGGFLLGILESMTAGYISTNYQQAISFLVLIAVLIFKPSGLLGKLDPEKV